MQAKERLISCDDHVELSHAKVKEFLATPLHSDYDQAVRRFQATMGAYRSQQANSLWREQRGEKAAEEGQGWATGNYPSYGRAGHHSSAERLADMDTDGVDASITFCEVSAFRYLYMLERGSREATRAFNLALRDFASPSPDRLLVSHQIPIHDIEAAVAEVEWVASAGGKSVQLPVYPTELGLPDYWDARYHPLWSILTETRLPICCHTGFNTGLEGLAKRDPTPQRGVFVPMVPLSVAEAMGMWLLTGVFEQFPALKVVWIEPGVGWVNWWLYTVDDLVLRQGYRFPGLTELPSHYWKQNMALTFIDEPDVLSYANKRLGTETVLWSSDYPHPVSSWPNSQACAAGLFPGATGEERRLILSGNAERIFRI